MGGRPCCPRGASINLVDFEPVLPLLARAPVEELIFSIEVDTDDRDEDEAAERSCSYLAAWLAKNGYR